MTKPLDPHKRHYDMPAVPLHLATRIGPHALLVTSALPNTGGFVTTYETALVIGLGLTGRYLLETNEVAGIAQRRHESLARCFGVAA